MNDATTRELIKAARKRFESIPPADYLPSPVLSEKQWEIYALLRRRLPSDSAQVFCGSRLTAFFDPESPQYDSHQRSVIFGSSVIFGIATNPPFARPIVLVIEPGQPALERFLSGENLPWILYSEVVDSMGLVDHIEANSRHAALLRDRHPINYPEDDVAKALRHDAFVELERHQSLVGLKIEILEEIERMSPRLLHEVALAKMKPQFPLEILSQEEETYCRTASVDVVLHSRVPNVPLLAIEVDGDVHQLEGKKVKDRLKGSILQKFGIPLIRISPSEADFWTLKDPKHLSRFVDLLGSVVSHTAGNMRNESEFRVRQIINRRRMDSLDEQFSQSMFGRDFDHLSESQRVEVFRATFGIPTDDQNEIFEQFHLHLREQELSDEIERSVWPAELVEFAQAPSISNDAENGWHAETTFKMGGSRSIKLSSPRIRVSCAGIDAELFEVTMRSILVTEMADDVREQIRICTPAVRSGNQ